MLRISKNKVCLPIPKVDAKTFPAQITKELLFELRQEFDGNDGGLVPASIEMRPSNPGGRK